MMTFPMNRDNMTEEDAAIAETMGLIDPVGYESDGDDEEGIQLSGHEKKALIEMLMTKQGYTREDAEYIASDL